jgi:hypothetical protein
MTKKSSDDRRDCVHRGPPPRPSVTGGGGSTELVFAVSSFDFGAASEGDAGPRYRSIGFDLDDTCTGEGQGPSCVEPPWADASHADGVDGIDNASGQLWWGKGFGPQTTTGATPVGMFRVRAYSGQPDDDQVEVSLYVGVGLAPRADGGSDPLWDGNDRWDILPDMLESSSDGGSPSLDDPRFRDDHAYVSGGVLVAQFQEALWTNGLRYAPKALTRVHQLILAGSLERVGEGWELNDVVVDMRTQFNEALVYAAHLPDPMTGMPVCDSEADYLAAKRNICPFLDIASVPGPPSAPCDALSTGVLLQAKQAAFGSVLQPSPPPSPLTCATGKDPATDTCEASADH